MEVPTVEGPMSQIQPRTDAPNTSGPADLKPPAIKTFGYLVSCVSVALLGVAAFPGAQKAGMLPALFGGMALSIIGMGLRWLSYEVEQRRKKAASALDRCRSNAHPSVRRG